MKSTIEYLDEAKKKVGKESDRQFGIWAGIKANSMSQYRTGIRTIDDYAAAKIAEALKIDPMIVIAAANAEREKGERREYWEKVSKRLGGIAAGFLFFSIALPVQAIHSATQCILC